jgi:hypothetical protein
MVSAQIKEASNGFVLQLEKTDDKTGKQEVDLVLCKSLAELYKAFADWAGERWDSKVISLVK